MYFSVLNKLRSAFLPQRKQLSFDNIYDRRKLYVSKVVANFYFVLMVWSHGGDSSFCGWYYIILVNFQATLIIMCHAFTPRIWERALWSRICVFLGLSNLNSRRSCSVVLLVLSNWINLKRISGQSQSLCLMWQNSNDFRAQF